MSDVDVADLFQAELDEPTLATLFATLAELDDPIEIRAKGGAQSRVGPDRLSLDEARALLASGTVRGIQIRYRFEGAVWLDTLMAGPETVRLVRIRAPA